MISKHLLKRVAILLVAVLAWSVPLQAQTAVNDWSSLSRIETGARLSIKTKSGKSVDGNLNSMSDSAISVQVKKVTVEIQRQDVQTIHRVVKKSAMPATLIGAGVGAGAGALVGAIGSNSDSGFGVDKIDHAITAGLAVLGAAAGAVTGYFIGRSSRKKELIYEAR